MLKRLTRCNHSIFKFSNNLTSWPIIAFNAQIKYLKNEKQKAKKMQSNKKQQLILHRPSSKSFTYRDFILDQLLIIHHPFLWSYSATTNVISFQIAENICFRIKYISTNWVGVILQNKFFSG